MRLIFYVLASQISFAQNLVPNPSFEDTISCPHNLTQIDRAVGWSSYRESPDYFNSCDPPGGFGDVSVPANSWGFQYPRSGNAYAGLGTLNITVSNVREFLGVQLIQPLNIGQWYSVTFYAVRAKSLQPYINISSNKIGVTLSTISYSQNTPAGISNFPQIFSDSIISDTSDWIQVSGIFLADSAYQYLSIGNFFGDSLTSYYAFDSLSTVAYYYIDDVELSPLDSITEGIFISAKQEPIKVFPNPASDWIIIQGKEIQEFTMYNVLGELCFRSTLFFIPSTKISVGQLNKGVYYATIKTKSGYSNQKIIIQ